MENAKYFVLFRCFFNARFYYPVFTVIFLDHGLSLESFALLNSLWALSIILLEVPSGALADILGRRNLVLGAALMMFAEMLVLLLVPPHSPLVIWAFALNRILSGAAEAAASGADEALVYDSLPEKNREELWSQLLSRTLRWQSALFLFAMLSGAWVYDHSRIQKFLEFWGYRGTIPTLWTLKAPIAMCLLTSMITIYAAFRMKEVQKTTSDSFSLGKCWSLGKGAFRMTLSAGMWILRTPSVFVVILFGLSIDSVIRMFLTINSEYYRSIGIQEAAFGLIGAGASILGIFLPSLGRGLSKYFGRIAVGTLHCALCVVGLWGIASHFNLRGLFFVFLLFIPMHLLGYFMSLYIHKDTPANMRATVLSFKGLSYNVAYGATGLFYSWLIAYLRHKEGKAHAFELSLKYFAPTFVLLLLCAFLVSAIQRSVLKAKK